jgi:putative tributyrin esterase
LSKVKTFRSFELSNPEFENAGLRYITVKSANLKGRGDIVLYVPSALKRKTGVPLIILLHGVYGSAWAWAMSGGVHVTAEKMIRKKLMEEFIIAMPSDGLWGDGSAYLAHNGYDFEKWIVEDVPAAVRKALPCYTDRSINFIAGLSMGGFGALRIGAKYADRFRAISGHSSLTDIYQLDLFVEEPLNNYSQSDGADESLFKTIQKHKKNLPPLRFDCGKDDTLLEVNRLLHKQLNQYKITHVYEEFEGGHNWMYWQEHIKQTFIFFSAHL